MMSLRKAIGFAKLILRRHVETSLGPAYGGSRVLDYFDELADDGDGARIGLGELGEISEELGAFGCRGDDRGVAPVLFCHGSVLARARFKRPLESRQVVARHERSFEEGALVLDPRHVLPLLEHKLRAVSEATALMQGQLPPVFPTLREALRPPTRRPDREWVQILRLLEDHRVAEVEAAVAEALERGSPRLETVRLLLRRRHESDAPQLAPAPVARPDLATLTVEPPTLSAYDTLWTGA